MESWLVIIVGAAILYTAITAGKIENILKEIKEILEKKGT